MENGTMPESIACFTNNCTLVAVKELTGRSDDDILTAFRNHGYIENDGCYAQTYLNALKELGYDPQGVRSFWGATVKFFLKNCDRTATYLVRTSGHAFVIRKGVVVDPNYRRRGAARILRGAWLIPNAHEPEVGDRVRFVRSPWNAKRFGTKSYARYAKAHHYAGTMWDEYRKRPTAEELIANTEYTRADLKYDLDAGHVEMVK
jgi:hypothetical protein